MIFFEFLFWLSLGIVGYAYIGYPMVLWVLQRVTRPIRKSLSTETPSVSIVIAAYNEEEVIGERIDNCLALDYPKELVEVCVGSDGSSDGTNRIVSAYQHEGVRLFAYPKRRGKVGVLNETVSRANGEILVFTDANTFFENDALRKLLQHFGDPRVGCVCGSVRFVTAAGSNTGGSEGLYWSMERWLKQCEGGKGAVIGASGPIYAMRRELYEAYPEDTITEDFVIAMKVLQRGYWVVYDAEAKATEQAGVDTAGEMERRARIGAGNFQALGMLLPMLDPRRGFPAFAFLSHKVLRWFSPHMMAAGLVANVVLALGGNRFYTACLLAQLLFYSAALVGSRAERSGNRLRLVRACHYFVAMNVSLFMGFVRFLRSAQAVTWQRTER